MEEPTNSLQENADPRYSLRVPVGTSLTLFDVTPLASPQPPAEKSGFNFFNKKKSVPGNEAPQSISAESEEKDTPNISSLESSQPPQATTHVKFFDPPTGTNEASPLIPLKTPSKPAQDPTEDINETPENEPSSCCSCILV